MNTKRKFIPGLQLSEQFYSEVVKGLFEREFPGLKYSAGLINYGSEVLGFDTVCSTDHHWGPPLLLFLSPEDIRNKKQISNFFNNNLPSKFLGYSTHFGNPDETGVQILTEAKAGEPINHRIEIYTVESFFKSYLLINPGNDLTTSDWLTISEQKLRTIRSGKIFFDQLGLKKIKKRLHYFPKSIWLYMLASEWMKISQEEPFIGRTGEANDEIGSRIIGARLVHSIMKLSFLMEKEYAPYSKWFGKAFSNLRCSKKLSPILEKVLSSKNWKEREKYLSQAYKVIAQMHNALKLTKRISTDVSRFHDRPYLVIHGEVFAAELKKKIKDTTVKKIAGDIGSVNQFSKSIDLLENDKLLKKLKVLYR